MRNYVLDSQRRRRWFRRRLKFYLFFLFLWLIVVGGVYTVREAQLFRIAAIEVIGLADAEREQFLSALKPVILESRTARLFGENNYFSWPNEISYSDLETAEVKIKKDLLARKVVIHPIKRARLGIWCFEGNEPQNCVWFDEKDGTVLSEAPQTAGRLIYKIGEESGTVLEPGSKILPNPLFGNLKKIVLALDNLKIVPKSLFLERSLQEFTVMTSEGAEFVFSLRFDPTLNALAAVAKLLEKTPLTAIRRLDLTVENKIYLKSK